MKKLGDVVTPVAPCSYPWLNKPDHGRGEFADPDGKFKVQLILDPANNEKDAAWMEKMRGKLEESRLETVEKLEAQGGKGKAKLKTLVEAPFFHPEVDDEGDETGRYIIKLNQKRIIRFTDKKTGEKKVITKTINFIDSAGKEMKNPPNVYGGSTIQVKGPVSTYYAADKNAYGISMKITTVRVVDLVSSGGGDLSAGFDTDEDGYTYDGPDAGFETSDDDFNSEPPSPTDNDYQGAADF